MKLPAVGAEKARESEANRADPAASPAVSAAVSAAVRTGPNAPAAAVLAPGCQPGAVSFGSAASGATAPPASAQDQASLDAALRVSGQAGAGGAVLHFAPEDQTQDLFLGGRLRLSQPRYGYRAAADPVMLAASCPARTGESVLELGCGVGVASFCLGARVTGVRLHGLELQPAYAELARHNALVTGISLDVHEGDLREMPAALRRGFDHVIANPPYFTAQGGTAARDGGRETAQREETSMADWMLAARKRLHPGGWLTLIQAADRLPDILAGLEGFGAIAVLPLQPRPERAANRILLRARKGARGAFRLLAPLVMHDGPQHDGDRENYSPELRAVLRDGAAITRFGGV